MRLPVLCALVLVAWACACARAQQSDPDRRVSCVPCQTQGAANASCPEVRPQQCRSGRLTRCGCCQTCLVHIGNGDFCVGAIPTNGVCNPPMRCEANECRNATQPF